MKNSLRLLLILGPILGIIAGIYIEREWSGDETPATHETETALEHAAKHMDPTYVCPMHPEIVSKDADSSCPICGMDLVPVKHSETSDADDSGHPVVEVSPAVMNSLGVRTVKLERKDLSRRVETPGFVQQIKKGKMSYFKAPLDGVLTEHLFERNTTYEDKGVPLVAIESDALLEAQTKHLEIYASSSSSDKAGTEKQPKKIGNDDVSDAAVLGSYLDEDGKITGEYRDKLYAMGHKDESIAELEAEMQSMMKDFAKTEDKQKPDKKKTKSENNSISPLEESRSKLRRLGMRNQEILELERNGKPSNRLVMFSNHTGRVLDMRVAEGMEVTAGEQLFKLGGEVRAVVVANAFQRDAAWITTGQRVEVRMPHESGYVWPGIVNQGAISINPDSQNIGIKLTFTAPLDKVRSNMYVVGTIFGDTHENVLSIPTQAVIRTEGEDRVVKALGDGRFKPVAVKLGVEAGAETEIVEGLEEGDEVVIMSQFLIDSESSLQASLQRLTSQ